MMNAHSAMTQDTPASHAAAAQRFRTSLRNLPLVNAVPVRLTVSKMERAAVGWVGGLLAGLVGRGSEVEGAIPGGASGCAVTASCGSGYNSANSRTTGSGSTPMACAHARTNDLR